MEFALCHTEANVHGLQESLKLVAAEHSASQQQTKKILRLNTMATETAKAETERAKYDKDNAMKKVNPPVICIPSHSIASLTLILTLNAIHPLPKIEQADRKAACLHAELAQNQNAVSDLTLSLKREVDAGVKMQHEMKKQLRLTLTLTLTLFLTQP